MAKPIVATSVDGLRDVLTGGVNSLVVPPKDPESLAAAMESLLDDEALSRRLSESALATSKRFDIQTFVSKMESLYELLVRRHRADGRRPRWDYARDFEFLEDPSPGARSVLRDSEPQAVSS
jgi:hypothetical protein